MRRRAVALMKRVPLAGLERLRLIHIWRAASAMRRRPSGVIWRRAGLFRWITALPDISLGPAAFPDNASSAAMAWSTRLRRWRSSFRIWVVSIFYLLSL